MHWLSRCKGMTLKGRFIGAASCAVLCVIVPFLVWQLASWQIIVTVSIVALLFTNMLCRCFFSALMKPVFALEVGLLNFKDGEFSHTLAYSGEDELGRLCTLYNETAQQLRQEKQWIYQRELMLDKVLQSSPQALLLVDSNDIVVFSNYSARALCNSNTPLEGMRVDALMQDSAPDFFKALRTGRDGLFSLNIDKDETQTWHLATGQFLLNNQSHKLYLFKQLTRELSRQEVAVWKKVIRIISHELNNSLGPMSSMLHSAKLLTNHIDDNRLERVYSTIEERIHHLSEFVQGYGKFAKLPQPKYSQIDWGSLLDGLQQQWQFNLPAVLPEQPFFADQVQLEQLFINLLKNAHESGSESEAVNVNIMQSEQGATFTVQDNGKGMSETVMANALIPFYSTKSTGSGLGLALCREIVEAHNGQLSLHNHDEGGVIVKIFIPVFIPNETA
ncbi:histidine kinase [Pseudoalteromonas aurantia]|uniref:histidine kinase n=2 Tax=Pseudoalteromonas aurantia TaxID=43654 RepID=A0A5S3V7M9_9GAMM|nr:histidine kinase [Pseudoalteromonas aurantia]TMO67573.1 histidine kinase [Pseudoalteromonas aurantia]